MRRLRCLVAISLLSLLSRPCAASAQRTVAHDTLSDSTPVAVTCGFCASEAIGVVFRELPSPLRGIDPGDFPLELREVQIALAAARTTGVGPAYGCEGDLAGGTALADVLIFAGTTPPTGSIAAEPLYDVWSDDETLVWAGVEVPIELSVPDADGSTRFELMLNRFPIASEGGGVVTVAGPATYLRVVVVIPAGGASTLCDASALEPPAGVPVRDDDGRIANERSFLFAAGGTGFLWNEAGGVNGDWAIRVLIVPAAATPRDGGGRDPDAAAIDGGADPAMDAAPLDAGTTITGGGGCSCRAAGSTRRALPGSSITCLAALGLAFAGRRRRRS